ncbi:hypothetical protein SVAN01_07746 [Stagonosporopsis vannaccii]|nr:hypothetical protein SVAN01_07746 [Stagonosporopsis vannaccii]
MTECLSVLVFGFATVTECRVTFAAAGPTTFKVTKGGETSRLTCRFAVQRLAQTRGSCATRHKECGERQRFCAPVWGTALGNSRHPQMKQRQRIRLIHSWKSKARDALCSYLVSRRRPSESHDDWPKIARETKEMIRTVDRATAGGSQSWTMCSEQIPAEFGQKVSCARRASRPRLSYEHACNAEITIVEPWAYRPRNEGRTETVWVWSHSGRLKHCGRRG